MASNIFFFLNIFFKLFFYVFRLFDILILKIIKNNNKIN